MDESSMLFDWAMGTLQQEHPPASATYAVLNELLQDGTTAAAQGLTTDSWNSGDWQFTPTMATHYESTSSAAAATPPSSLASGDSSVRSAASSTWTGHTSPEQPCTHQHVMAERKRRENINLRFIDLSSVIPGLKRMNKVTILSDAVRYIKEQQEKIKELERRGVPSNDSVVLAKRPCLASIPDSSSLPEIEVRISDSNVMLRIRCEVRKGVLGTLLTEVEGLHLTITHTDATTFPACTVNITIMAKVDEGLNIKSEDIAMKLDAALRRRHGGK